MSNIIAQPAQRICSLLPSATEIVGKLGLADRLVCISHECDIAETKEELEHLVGTGRVARVTLSAINPELYTQFKIDELVTSALHRGESLYGIDNAIVAKARPDLIITQDLCSVCAPSSHHVSSAVEHLKNDIRTHLSMDDVDGTHVFVAERSGALTRKTSQCTTRTRIVSLEPQTLLGVADSFVTVATACGEGERGHSLRRRFLADLQSISDSIKRPNHCTNSNGSLLPSGEGAARANEPPKVFILEWLDPPFDAGHWVPEILSVAMGEICKTSCAGGVLAECSAAADGSEPSACSWGVHKSKRISWSDVAAADPDTLVISCCGFDFKRNCEDARDVLSRVEEARTLRAVRDGRVFALDGNRYLARPGPSLVHGAAAVAAAAWHGDASRMHALHASGLVPEEGDTWGAVPVTLRELVAEIEEAHVAAAAPCAATWYEAHADAARRGNKFYSDPETGLSVMTQLVHAARGSCCGRGCRHCPYMHEGIPLRERPDKISRPAWLVPPRADVATGACAISVCICASTEGDINNVIESQSATPGGAAVLAVPFDYETRAVQGSKLHVRHACDVAAARDVPVVGLPMHGNGPPLEKLVDDVLSVVRTRVAVATDSLAMSVQDSLGRHADSWRLALRR